MAKRRVYPYLILFGWIFPLIIPIITIAVTNDYYVNADSHCFLNSQYGVIWAFIVPILIIISINMILLVIAVIRVVISRHVGKDIENAQVIRDAIILGLILTPILGVPWLLLILNIFIQHTAVEWIFIIINGSMGVVFFLIVVLRNREVHSIFKKIKSKGSFANSPVTQSSTNDTSTIINKFKKRNDENSPTKHAYVNELSIAG